MLPLLLPKHLPSSRPDLPYEPSILRQSQAIKPATALLITHEQLWHEEVKAADELAAKSVTAPTRVLVKCILERWNSLGCVGSSMSFYLAVIEGVIVALG